jgi:ankyrin repeat protein
MRKTVIALALIAGFSMSNLNAHQIETTHDVSVNFKKNSSEITALCKAVAYGNIDEVKRLIRSGASVNEKSEGMLPIHFAAKFNRVEILKVLITAGSDVHERCDNGITPVKYAERANAEEAAQFLKRFK